jgi:hypothetical protein
MLELFAHDLMWLKFPFCIVSSTVSVAVFFVVKGRAFETTALRSGVIAVTLLKFIACFLIYAFLPLDWLGSDAALQYFPEATQVLSGAVPYRDFATSYSPLFHVILIPGLLLWHSPGSIVLTMLLVETAMLVVYAMRCRKMRFPHYWRVLFLYSSSPLSSYWVGAVGYNSVIIALFVMISLSLAEAKRDWPSGVAAALGLLFSKITMILSWPAIVFFRPRGFIARGAPIVVILFFLAALTLFDIDVSYKALHQKYRATSGNIWFLVSMLGGIQLEAVSLKQLSMLSILCVFGPACLFFLSGRIGRSLEGFDSTAAFVATANLIFMALAYKTYPWYFSMFIIFVIHTLLADDEPSLAKLIPLIFLGSVTNVEPALGQAIRGTDPSLLSWTGSTLLALDIAILVGIAYWAALCFRRSIANEYAKQAW